MSLRLSTRASSRVRATHVRPVAASVARRTTRIAAAGIALTLVLSACLSDQELQGHDLVSAARRDHGVGALSVHPELQLKAHEWARYLASTGKLEHSELTAGIAAPWIALGETVSSSGSATGAFDAQMRSDGHRRKLLDPKFTHVGVGIAEARGQTYFVVVLMQL